MQSGMWSGRPWPARSAGVHGDRPCAPSPSRPRDEGPRTTSSFSRIALALIVSPGHSSNLALGSRIALNYQVPAEMISSLPGRRKHFHAGAALRSLAVIAGMRPAPARAGCPVITYVTSKLSQSTGTSLPEFELFRDGGTSHSAPRRDLPCSGPSCSRRRDLPQAPQPAFVSPPTSDRSSWTRAETVWILAASGRQPANPSTPHPRHGSFPIERPPRDIDPSPLA